MDFSHYTDPKKAEAVVRDYNDDIKRYGLTEVAEDLIKSCRSHRNLDIALNNMISKQKSSRTRGRNRSFF